MKTRWSAAVLWAVLLFALSGCDRSSAKIVGKWNSAGTSEAPAWEFFENGSVETGTIRGRYKLGDNKRLKIETPFATSVYQVEFSGQRMTLTSPGGSKLEFERAK